ncbi:PQQ-dependent dehydrogenase, methanol/ethanol family [Kineobactrum salinum]|uniref:PQQ-dependent dehydrogenase, methanol/ethanol family n=1 Tax=Kineobactrum salinum TaxID=2708301 RepID=A0A6C0U3Y0_9GAMM|nr:PQQ-dependent dehydrogenase, methanol/ethanol family [Kineobactrum salinum]QIB64144.1 PQQ-dependent dehydrogenase, methanol/ethanol family [Kineobactrum salinum]
MLRVNRFAATCAALFFALLLSRSGALLATGVSQSAQKDYAEEPHSSEASFRKLAPPDRRAVDLSYQQRLLRANHDSADWLLHGRTFEEQRYSSLRAINRDTVADLGLAWQFDTDSTRGLEATPIVRDGVMYTTGTWSVVYALDARTGELLWSYDPEVPGAWARRGCCDVVNRGVALWDDRVLSATFDGRLIALDARTGELLWQTNTVDRSRAVTITGAPRVLDGKVLIGNAGAEFNVRGYVSAYDVGSGELLWRFYTVPGSVDGPHEHPELELAAKTWSEEGEWLDTGGGGTVWDSISYDPELNLVYVGTGNGAPHARFRRSPGGGDNLYLSSIVALDADTGRMRWYYQTTPGDSWDFTATQQMILADMEIDGDQRKVLMQAPKNGFFYVLDRVTGELISAEKLVTITWASHIENGRPVETDQADFSEEDKLIYPSELGGHNWHPMSYSPETGLVYVPALERGWIFSPTDFYLFDFNPPAHLDELRRGQPDVDEGGYLKAWDPVRQKTVWQVKNNTFMNGGTLATAGGLVFQGTEDGYLNAYNDETGERLLHLFLGTGVIAPPITYEVDGEQYVALMAGFGGATLFMLGEDAAARRYVNDGRLLVFKLKGDEVPMPKLAEPRYVPSAEAAEQTPTGTVDPERLRQGEQLFVRNCGFCHGMYGSRAILPDLTRMSPGINSIFEQIVLDGIFQSRGMASFKDVLSKEEVESIRLYLSEQ